MIACLDGLRRVGSQDVVLTHVFNVRDVGGLYASLKAGMAPRLEQQGARLAAAGFDVSVEAPLGIPFYEINRIADERSASLIVVGSLGASLVGQMLLGSTAHAVLQHAERRVLLIRLEISDADDEGQRCHVVCSDLFRHVLFPTDFSDTADRAFLVLEHIAREVAPVISLLHVQDRTKLDPHLSHRLEEFNRIDQDRLDRMRERLQGDRRPPGAGRGQAAPPGPAARGDRRASQQHAGHQRDDDEDDHRAGGVSIGRRRFPDRDALASVNVLLNRRFPDGTLRWP